MKSKPHIGANIRRLRTALGLTQEKLAGSVGVGRASIAQFERGSAHPSTETQEKLAAALGVPVVELVGPAPAPTHPPGYPALAANLKRWIAGRVGVTQGDISTYETGQCTPSQETQGQLSEVFGEQIAQTESHAGGH